MGKSIPWDADAEAELKRAPFFIRKLARSRVEKAARERGMERVTMALVEQVKNREMPR